MDNGLGVFVYVYSRYAMKVYRWKGFRFPPKLWRIEVVVIISIAIYFVAKYS